MGRGVAVPLFESRDAYASKIDHSFAVAAYSTEAGGSVMVAELGWMSSNAKRPGGGWCSETP